LQALRGVHAGDPAVPVVDLVAMIHERLVLLVYLVDALHLFVAVE
jgi:hypothetical protein